MSTVKYNNNNNNSSKNNNNSKNTIKNNNNSKIIQLKKTLESSNLNYHIEDLYKKNLLNNIFESISTNNEENYGEIHIINKIYNKISDLFLKEDEKNVKIILKEKIKVTHYYKTYENLEDLCYLFFILILIKIFNRKYRRYTRGPFSKNNSQYTNTDKLYGEMAFKSFIPYIKLKCLKIKTYHFIKKSDSFDYQKFINCKDEKKLELVNNYTNNDWKKFWNYIFEEIIINKFYKPTFKNKNKYIEEHRNFMYQIFEEYFIKKQQLTFFDHATCERSESDRSNNFYFYFPT